MLSLHKIFESIILEGVSTNDVNDAINNKYRVNITYSGDDDNHNGKRHIQVYAYGLLKNGTPAIRAYQLFGDTKTGNGEWKLFRIDRITSWQKTNMKFSKPVSDYDHTIPPFNKNGDRMMSTVYNIAKFNK